VVCQELSALLRRSRSGVVLVSTAAGNALTDFLPALRNQLADEQTVREDAEARGWDGEVARHARVIARLQRHLDRLAPQEPPRWGLDPEANAG
jgi:hypothetical protein